ncbi:MAG: hypothetical protein GY803_10315 [Chloroflexi bacterium]|nr:hypothetical protein [Chloroflexota bacterium]
MRITPAIRFVAIFLSLVLAGLAAYTYHQSTQQELAYVFVENLPQYTRIESEEQLKEVWIPKDRDFSAVTNAALILGMYTGQNVTGGQLVQPSLLLERLPDGRRKFDNGLLPVNTDGYPILIPPDIAAIFQADDLVDIFVIVNQDGLPSDDDVMYPLFQKIRALQVQEGGSLVVALNYSQLAVYEGLRNAPGVSFTAAINQEANGDYPPLYPSQLYPDMNQEVIKNLFAAPTPIPVSEVDEVAAEGTGE